MSPGTPPTLENARGKGEVCYVNDGLQERLTMRGVGVACTVGRHGMGEGDLMMGLGEGGVYT